MTTFYHSIRVMTSLQSRVFGCLVFVHVHSSYQGKIDPQAIKYVFINYVSNKNGTNVITVKVVNQGCYLS